MKTAQVDLAFIINDNTKTTENNSLLPTENDSFNPLASRFQRINL